MEKKYKTLLEDIKGNLNKWGQRGISRSWIRLYIIKKVILPQIFPKKALDWLILNLFGKVKGQSKFKDTFKGSGIYRTC